jgi:hypothetical protein
MLEAKPPDVARVPFLDKPYAAYNMNPGKLIGEMFICIMVSGGQPPVEATQSVPARLRPRKPT